MGNGGSLDVQTIFVNTMKAFPEVAFASIDSKGDAIQIAFYQAVDYWKTEQPSILLPKMFSQQMDLVYARYQLQPNWVSYSVNSYHHMFLIDDTMYTTTPRGSKYNRTRGLDLALEVVGHHLSGDSMPLPEWLSEFPV